MKINMIILEFNEKTIHINPKDVWCLDVAKDKSVATLHIIYGGDLSVKNPSPEFLEGCKKALDIAWLKPN